MRSIGLFLIAASVLAPLYAVVQLAQIQPNNAIIAQYFGAVALISMAIGQLMATRLTVVDWIFGPLDKTYVLHKWLGIVAVVTMLVHDSIGAEIKNLKPKGAWSDFGEDLGELAQNGILILVAITLALFIPYNWWRLTHKFIGAFFVLAALHFTMVDKPFAITDPIGIYILTFCGIGIFSYCLTLLPPRMRGSFVYEVAAVTPTGNATAINLKPVGKPMRFRAGQFASFRFSDAGLQEPHPFTLSSAPAEDGSLRVSVGPLGRYTRRLGSTITVGTKVRVQGPFGRFGTTAVKKPQIWIAAGIGITPFTALLASLEPNHAPIELFYTFRGQANAPHLQELRDRAEQLSNVTLHIIDTTNSERLTTAQIVDTTALALNKTKVLFCGPIGLRDNLAKGLRAHGVSRRRFHYEEFMIRSDIWPLQMVNRPAKIWLAKLGI